MRLLIGIHELEITSKYKEHIRVVELAKKLNLSEEKTNLICEGLIQLNLVVDPVVDGGVMEAGKIYGKPYHDCCTTGLAQNLLNWCAEEVPTA